MGPIEDRGNSRPVQIRVCKSEPVIHRGPLMMNRNRSPAYGQNNRPHRPPPPISSHGHDHPAKFFIESGGNGENVSLSNEEGTLSGDLSFETCSFAEIGGWSVSEESLSPSGSPFGFAIGSISPSSSDHEFGPGWMAGYHDEVDIGTHVDPSVEETEFSIESLRTSYNSCFSCGVSWFENHVSLDCKECGGYAMQRPCADCDGKCSNVWTRDLAQSHGSGRAQFKGDCGNEKSEKKISNIPISASSCCIVTSNAPDGQGKGEWPRVKSSQSASSLTSVAS